MSMNINPAQWWTAIRKCLIEIRKLPLISYPLGKTSQFIRPVILNKMKRTKDIILTGQSVEVFFIYTLPFHSITGFLVFSWLLSLGFTQARRFRIFIHLSAGGLCHFLLDFFQVQYAPANYLLFPFAHTEFTVGLFEPESSLLALPFLVLASVIMFLSSRRNHGTGI